MPDTCFTTVVVNGPGTVVELDIGEMRLTGVHDTPSMTRSLETDHIIGEHAPADRCSHFSGDQAPVIRVRPRDVDEVLHRNVGPSFANIPGSKVKVVILEHNDGDTASCIGGC